MSECNKCGKKFSYWVNDDMSIICGNCGTENVSEIRSLQAELERLRGELEKALQRIKELEKRDTLLDKIIEQAKEREGEDPLLWAQRMTDTMNAEKQFLDAGKECLDDILNKQEGG